MLEVYERELRALVESADLLLEQRSSADALREWVQRLAQYAVTKHGLADALRRAGAPGSDLSSSETYVVIVATLDRLLQANVADSNLRGDVNADDVILALAGLWQLDPASDWQAQAIRLYDIVLGGLRATRT